MAKVALWSVPEVCLAGVTALAKSLVVATAAGLSPWHKSPLRVILKLLALALTPDVSMGKEPLPLEPGVGTTGGQQQEPRVGSL